jgi:hypothetical protein
MNLNVICDQRLRADRYVLAGGSFAGQSLLLIVTALLIEPQLGAGAATLGVR